MRSNSRRQRPYRFFKVVLPSNAKDKKLKIPPKFVSIFRDELADVATLTTPAGHVWHMGLEKASNKDCWFCDGWQEFAEHHSIFAGYFLLFRYEGNSKFRVSVYDLTACEISYPRDLSNGSVRQTRGKKIPVYPKEEEPEDDDDGSVEFLGSSPSWQPPTSFKEEQNHCACSNPWKPQKMAEGCLKSGMGIKKHGRDYDSLQSPKSRHVCSKESKRCKMKDSQTSDLEGTESEEDEPLMKHKEEAKTNGRSRRAARRHNPANPSFSVTMRPYNIGSNFMNVPAPFGRKYLRNGSIKLLDSSGRQWPVKCCRHIQLRAVKLTKGWMNFVADKSLKEGDVCFFELLQLKEPVLKVSISKQSEQKASSLKSEQTF